jgi:hypothetical protein
MGIGLAVAKVVIVVRGGGIECHHPEQWVWCPRQSRALQYAKTRLRFNSEAKSNSISASKALTLGKFIEDIKSPNS